MKNGVTEKNKEIVTLKTHMNQLQAEVNKLNGELSKYFETVQLFSVLGFYYSKAGFSLRVLK